MSLSHPALSLFDSLPLAERLFVRARLFSAPLEELVAACPSGHVLDAGCGHGLVTAMLAAGDQRTVLGIDPDERKIQLARDSVGRLPNVGFRVATLEQLGEQSELDAVVVADVLYLLPLEHWRSFLVAARRVLKRGGRLLLKEAEADGSWRHQKALWQEQLMVRVLGRTRDSGALGFQPRDVLESEVKTAGFRITRVAAFRSGYTTPHVLIDAEAV
ncbi:MAG: class I SAM-dependent methyltransferase [Myxococcaceae bacterium]|nr:class I SAM-dependent methyltransferase [Myxococcaceae bacterium]